VGIGQILLSNYERGRLRLSAEMAVRIALALDVSADELLGIHRSRPAAEPPSVSLMRRLEKIQKLPVPQRKALLRTLDIFLKGASEAAA
jgi:transcriptional regulator with XRE-family HTH domain